VSPGASILRGSIAVVLAACVAAWAAPQGPSIPRDDLPKELASEVPFGLPPLDGSEGGANGAANAPQAQLRAQLGRKLFFDPVLSADRTIACASCHEPAHGFSSPSALSTGVRGRTTLRHAPTLLNRAFGRHFMWDGRAATLEEQVLLPIENELEMDLLLDEALGRLNADGAYREAFQRAFDAAPGRAQLAEALASFVRRLYLADSPVDQFRSRGKFDALTIEERSGLWFWESRGGCWKCHSGPNFTDEEFHNTGVGAREGVPEEARFAVTGEPGDRGRFKTPTLRGLALTAPYMHDGSLATLEDVVAFYRRGANPNSGLDERLHPLEMSDADAVNLVAFLRALSKSAGK
jgi:cytochrome c peroxidase